MITENLFAAPALMNYSNKISTGRFGAGAGFTVQNGLKGELKSWATVYIML
jgi:hypothetical protein